jgi:hypothetical protein
MSLYVYIYKLNYGKGRPSWVWVQKSRWLFLDWEDSERYYNVLAKFEGWGYPIVPIGRRENRIRGYLVLKLGDVRDFLRLVASDLLHDAYISKDRMKSLESGGWDVEVVKPTPELVALWKVGLESKGTSKITEVRERFWAIIKALEKKGDEGEQGN